MAKLKLNADPTFKAKVGIPVPGRDAVSVEFTFKYRNRDELSAFIEELQSLKDPEAVQAIASAWELDDEFNAENVERLCRNYPGSASAIFDVYLRESTGARRGN